MTDKSPRCTLQVVEKGIPPLRQPGFLSESNCNNTGMSPTMSLKAYVEEQAQSVIERHRYHDPEEAFMACSPAISGLGARLDDIACFQTNVRIDADLRGTAWAREKGIKDPDHAWHWVLAVPEVGIVDVTGAQFGKRPLRIFEVVPPGWALVRRVKASALAPDPVDVWAQLCSGDPVSAFQAFEALMNVDQMSIGKIVSEGPETTRKGKEEA